MRQETGRKLTCATLHLGARVGVHSQAQPSFRARGARARAPPHPHPHPARAQLHTRSLSATPLLPPSLLNTYMPELGHEQDEHTEQAHKNSCCAQHVGDRGTLSFLKDCWVCDAADVPHTPTDNERRVHTKGANLGASTVAESAPDRRHALCVAHGASPVLQTAASGAAPIERRRRRRRRRPWRGRWGACARSRTSAAHTPRAVAGQTHTAARLLPRPLARSADADTARPRVLLPALARCRGR